MTDVQFLIYFYGQYILVIICIIAVIIRYIRKGIIKINAEKMIQCKLKDWIRKNSTVLNVIINCLFWIAAFICITEGCIPAVKDIPYAVNGEWIYVEGIVKKGGNIDSTNKLEHYNIIITDCLEKKDLEIEVYGKNGISAGEHIRVKYLPHSKDGILLERL